MSLACIASAAFKVKRESIVAEGDRRHISQRTALNAYIKSESSTGTGDISYRGVRSTRELRAYTGGEERLHRVSLNANGDEILASPPVFTPLPGGVLAVLPSAV